MSKTILLFPGQGSQYIGMGKRLAETPEADALLSQACEVMNFDLRTLLWQGPEDDLKKTQNTQPALFTVSMMAMECLKKENIPYNFAAGHSLGEYSALCAAGVFSFEQGLKLVRLRGELMSKAGSVKPGAMSAIIGLERNILEECVKGSASTGEAVIANYNSLSQIVISGEQNAVQAVEEKAREAGAKKVVRLAVSGAFHSPLMEYAAEGLKRELDKTAFANPLVPIITNVTASPCNKTEELKSLLVSQLTSPVRWVESILNAVELGSSRGIEMGAGKVLMGLVRGITRDLKVTPVESAEDVSKLKELE